MTLEAWEQVAANIANTAKKALQDFDAPSEYAERFEEELLVCMEALAVLYPRTTENVDHAWDTNIVLTGGLFGEREREYGKEAFTEEGGA